MNSLDNSLIATNFVASLSTERIVNIQKRNLPEKMLSMRQPGIASSETDGAGEARSDKSV
jgi:hypothetical protein